MPESKWERNLRTQTRFPAHTMQVYQSDVSDALAEIDSLRQRCEQLSAAALAGIELPKVGMTVQPAPLVMAAGR